MTMSMERSNVVRIVAIGLLATMAALYAGPATANKVYDKNTSSGVTLSGLPLAIHGYDAVAYFTEGKARYGKAEFTASYGDAAYRFASAANKAKFEQNPASYAPQYGGYCAFGMALGGKFDGDPNLFRIVDGKLYFNLNPDIRDKWVKDIPGYISTANKNWMSIQDKAPWELN